MDREPFDPERIPRFRKGDGPLGPEAEELIRAIIGAAIDVHRTLGPGFLESIYQAAFAIELEEREIRFTREAPTSIVYHGRPIGEGRIDLLVADTVIVELKTVESIMPIHQAQLISYLKALNLRAGLLINFNVPILKEGIKRIVL